MHSLTVHSLTVLPHSLTVHSLTVLPHTLTVHSQSALCLLTVLCAGMDTSQYHIGKWTILNGQQYSGQYYPRAYAGAVTVGCEMYILGGQRVVNGSISDKVTNDVQVSNSGCTYTELV